MSQDKEKEYIDYFRHMEDEHIKSTLGGMAWDEVGWWIYYATEKYKVFTKKELEEMFPILLKGIGE